MRINSQKHDIIFLLLLILIIIGLPFGIRAYDRYLEPAALTPDAKEFTLTGHAQKGWVLGEVKANDIISLWQAEGPAKKPVDRGDELSAPAGFSRRTHGHIDRIPRDTFSTPWHGSFSPSLLGQREPVKQRDQVCQWNF